MLRNKILGCLVRALAILISVPAAQAAWPDKPIKVVVAFEAGGTADRIARILSDKLSARLGAQVYVENRPGASGTVGSLAVARAAADGYTLLIAGSGPHITSPVINPNVGYDPVRDFTHIAMIAGDTYMLAASRQSGFTSLAELVAKAKAAQPPVNYGSPGAGSLGHLIMESFVRGAGIPFTHVPYKGGGPALNDILGGHIATVMLPVLNLSELIKAGTIVSLAVTSTERHAAYPQIPTFMEQGHRVQGTTWFWLAGPRGLAPEIVDRLERDLKETMQAPEIKTAFESQALLTRAMTRTELERFLGEEIALWSKVINDIGFKLE